MGLNDKIRNVVLVCLNKNLGFASANNVGLKLLNMLRGSLSNVKIVLLNPDTRILDKRFLGIAELLAVLPIVGFATVSGDNNNFDDSIGAYVNALGNSQDISVV